MPTVIHQLADAFLKRKEAAQRKTVFPEDSFMPKSSKQDLANRLSVFEQGGTPELLKQAAKEMYENPVVNTAISLTPGAGDIQSGYEAWKSAKEGDWTGAGLNAVGILPFVPALKTVWHGSPHSFEKFDLSKIGTGEGAQSYGHGLYLAEARPTAEEYAKNLSEDVMIPAKRLLTKSGNDVDAAINAANEEINRLRLLDLTPQSGSARRDSMVESQLSNLRELQKYKDTGEFTAGNLYKVDLPDEQIAKMLDWDKPLSEQSPHILEALKTVDLSSVNPRIRKLVKEGGADGQTIYKAFGGYENPSAASQRLNELGIPGIQYLDQASRGAADGTRNYVVFSDEIPTILERNGTSVFEFPK